MPNQIFQSTKLKSNRMIIKFPHEKNALSTKTSEISFWVETVFYKNKKSTSLYTALTHSVLR
jgi:hypothetical protein